MPDTQKPIRREDVEGLLGPPTNDPLWPPENVMDNWNAIRSRILSLFDEQEKRIEELKKQKRSIMCMWCGYVIVTEFDRENGLPEAIKAAQEHDLQCSKNPAVAELSSIKERIKELEIENRAHVCGECLSHGV